MKSKAGRGYSTHQKWCQHPFATPAKTGNVPQLSLLVLIAGFRAGVAGLNLGYTENPTLKPGKPD